jgi:tRNA-Thr(GGU) m(6)t(6)A37 methyltransferase TsaA
LDKTEKVNPLKNTDTSQITLRPVGRVRNKVQTPFLKSEHDGIIMSGDLDTVREHIRETQQELSEIIIDENLMDTLEDIETYSHITILYWADQVPEQCRSLTKVHPMGRKENPLVGIFSTYSPARPNPVLMTVVRLYKRKHNVLYVTGLDAVNGSPVIDIKPFVREFYPQDNVKTPDWMQRIIEDN